MMEIEYPLALQDAVIEIVESCQNARSFYDMGAITHAAINSHRILKSGLQPRDFDRLEMQDWMELMVIGHTSEFSETVLLEEAKDRLLSSLPVLTPVSTATTLH